MNENVNASKIKHLKTVQDADMWNPLGDFYTASKALVQDLASVNAQVLDTVERPNGSQTACCIWESGPSYRVKWLLSLPGDNPVFCKNEGCRRIGSSDEALQLNKERVPLLHSVTGEYHITNQACGIKPKTTQPSEFWLGLRVCTNVSPCPLPWSSPLAAPSCRHTSLPLNTDTTAIILFFLQPLEVNGLSSVAACLPNLLRLLNFTLIPGAFSSNGPFHIPWTSLGTAANDFHQFRTHLPTQTVCQVLTILKGCTVKKAHPWTHNYKISSNKDIYRVTQ